MNNTDHRYPDGLEQVHHLQAVSCNSAEHIMKERVNTMMSKFETAVLEAKEKALNTEVWTLVYEELERQRDWNLSYVHDADGNITDDREIPDPENDNEWNGYPFRKYQMYQEILQFVERKILSK